MSELCPVCGNQLSHGDCGNLSTYCDHCRYAEGVGIDHRKEKERLLKEGDELLLDYLEFMASENNLPEEDKKTILKRMYRHQQKLIFDAKCVPWTFEEELKDKKDDII